MKKLLFGLVLICPLVHFGQYKAVVSTQNTWLLTHQIIDAGHTDSAKFTGSVFLGFKHYLRISVKENELDGYRNAIYLREDVNTGKIWSMELADTTETLIFDLSLNVGDTFKIHYFYPDFWQDGDAIVTNVEIVDGRKVITLNKAISSGPASEKLKFIEGVGPNVGFFYQASNKDTIVDNYPIGFLICRLFSNGTVAYEWDPINHDCGISVGINEFEKNYFKLEISPNPGTGTFYIDASDIVVSDITGKIVLRSDQPFIDLSPFNSGVYFVRGTKDGRSGFARLIKK